MAAEKLKLDQPFHLQILEEGNKVFEQTFHEAPITIGRSVNCHVSLPKHKWISRQHFQVTMVDGHWVATDLNSAHGLTYQGLSYTHIRLQSGMALEVGPLQFLFRFSTLEEAHPVEMKSHESAYPHLDEATKSALVSTQTKSLPRPVQFRNTRRFKLNEAWFAPKKKSYPILKGSCGSQSLTLNAATSHVTRSPSQRRALEAYVTWKDQVYDSRIYFAGDNISIGTHTEDLYAPNLKGSFLLGRFDGQHADFYLNKGVSGTIYRPFQQTTSLEQLINSELLPRRDKGYALALSQHERCEINLGANLKLHARYTAAPRQLSKTLTREPDRILRKAMTFSGSLHFAFLLLALLLAPAQQIPKVKHLPPRVAKLLLPKEPVITPAPTTPPAVEPVQVKEPLVRKKTIEVRKPLPVPKKVVIRTNKKLQVINKLPHKPMVMERPTPPDIKQLGALAALGALGTPTVKNNNQPIAINVNPNAGGQSSLSTSSVIGALKAKGGRLAASGSGVKTTGKGYGSGQEYGVQGLQGVAGQRGVAGAVVGSPKLMTVARTEGLTQKQVMDVVKQHVAQIQQCYERSLLSKPNLAGRVEYEWEISAIGIVKWIKVKRSDLAQADILNNCITGVFKNMKFPVAKNGEHTTPTIGFPFGRL